MAQLEKIYLKRGKLTPMDEVSEVRIKAGKGLVGNTEQNGLRQITILEKEIWEELMQAHQSDLSPKIRRSNLLISGLPLKDSRKKILVIGNCEIEIFGETKPCERMDEALMGLQKAMYKNWKGGAFGKALIDGVIKTGDQVFWKY